MGEPVRLELTADEALVLFEFLARYEESNSLNIVDQAEQCALWGLQALFEKQLVEPFLPNYVELVAEARNRLRDQID